MNRGTSKRSEHSRNVTPYDLIAVLIVVCVLFVPMFLLATIPENLLVQQLLGGWRLFLFYGATLGPLMLVERWMMKQKWFKRSRFFVRPQEPFD